MGVWYVGSPVRLNSSLNVIVLLVTSFGKSEGNGPDRSGYGRRDGSKPEHSNFGRIGGEFSNTDAKAKDFSGVAGRAGRVYGSGGSSGPKSMPAAKPRPVKLPWK